MARERDHEARLLSAGVAVACHVGLGWWLLNPAPQRIAPPPEPALQVIWLEPATPAAPLSVPPPARAPGVSAVRAEVRVPSPAPQVPERGEEAAIPQEAHLPAAAALLEQGLQWARAQQAAPDFVPDPLRSARTGASDPGRFAMRDPLTPAAVLRAIGTLVGGPDYEADPCPRIRRNLAALGPAGDSELMREEIRRLQSLCM